MVNLTGIFIKTLSRSTGDNTRLTILAKVKKKSVIINLWSPWDTIAEYIKPYTSFNLFNAEKVEKDGNIYFSAGRNAIFVIDPNVLLNATSVNSVSYCPRSYYVGEIIGDTPSPYIAIKGSIIHNCLSSAIVSKTSPSIMLPDMLDSFALHYEYHGYNKNDVFQEVKEMAECLDPFMKKLSGATLPEILFLSPHFGIRGRIDVFDSNKIYELKTGKVSDEDEIRFSDLLQVSLYRYGLENITKKTRVDSGTVVYVGTKKSVFKEAQPSWGLLRFGMEMRNLAYRISYQGYVPPILPPEQRRRCEKCFVRHYCFLLCSGLNHERNCSTCPHSAFCTKKSLPQSYQDYFNNFSNLIREEKIESSQVLSDLWKLSVTQRVDKGKTITNMVLENEFTDKDLKKLLFSCENKSELREGDIIVLSDGDVLSGSVSTGVISQISGDSIEVETRSVVSGVTTVDVYIIDVGYRRQQRGLFNMLFKRNNFRDQIIDAKGSIVKQEKGKFIPNNSIQNAAIGKILGTENYCLIQGPAGTGKTYVIAKAAIFLANRNKKILLTAFTNRAVDNICSYLIANGFHDFVRLGDKNSIQPEIHGFILSEYQKKSKDKSVNAILDSIPVVVATTSTISNPLFEKLGIQTIIIDEASQMTEPTVLSALIEGNRFILVGDHKQLPPVVQSPKGQQDGLNISLFERLAKKHPESIHLLTHQYRMNEKIIEYPNLQFYDSKLESFDDKVKNQTLADLKNYSRELQPLDRKEIYDPKNPLVFVPISGNFIPNKKINKKEAKEVGGIAKNFIKLGVKSNQIGIICPYRGQVAEIRRYLPKTITVDTVDRFQGSDREIIILSLTESTSFGNKGFADERRLNVAVTRAKKKLVVVGDSNIQQENLMKYCTYLREKAIIPAKTRKIVKPQQLKQDVIIIADTLSKTVERLDKSVDLDDSICLICQEEIYENATRCPHCKQLFHFNHLLTWVKETERCPYCKIKLSIAN